MRAALAFVAWCAEQVAPRYGLEVGWEQAILCGGWHRAGCTGEGVTEWPCTAMFSASFDV